MLKKLPRPKSIKLIPTDLIVDRIVDVIKEVPLEKIKHIYHEKEVIEEKHFERKVFTKKIEYIE